jgi:poly-gamma-glutamate capsule biosynthesis protein CapA/YwtB (metallophosphatase superfamily)
MRRRIRVMVGASFMLALTAWAMASTPGGERDGPVAVAGRRSLIIHGTGDVSLDPVHISAFQTHGYDWAWSGVGDLFRDDDLTLVNLECPVTHVVDPVPKAFILRCDPAALPAARGAGVDVVSQANNHAYDQGSSGLLDSLERLRAAGLSPVGAGSDRAEALSAEVFSIDGWSVAVVGIDQVLDPLDAVAGSDKPGTAAGHDFGLALRAIRRADASSDVLLVTIHWGVEGETRPTALQVEQAHRLVRAGADAIFGAHAHRIQSMETYRGRPIFYGLGNFVWPDLSAAGSDTAVAEVRVGSDGTFRGRFLPAEIVSDGHPLLVPR